MYAIIETGGKQYRVVPGEKVLVERLDKPVGAEMTFKALWAVGDAKDGQEAPVSRQAVVSARVEKALKGPKILVFRKKPKKAYKKMQGHRQSLTELSITSISLN